MTKFAIIECGGKQYRVTEGQSIRVEKLPVEEGQPVRLDQVLLVGEGEVTTKIGDPIIAGAHVEATVLGQKKGKKIDIIKLKRRKHHIKHMGHRQKYTEIKINQIVA